jgi:hypothetical protein
VSYESSDCDGGHGNYYAVAPELEGNETDPGYRDVRQVAADLLPMWGEQQVSMRFECYEPDEDEGEYTHVAWLGWRTEEGGVRVELRSCMDDCDLGRSSVYDQFAELAGY